MFPIKAAVDQHFASGYVHQMLCDENKNILYARIAGRPEGVRAFMPGFKANIALTVKGPGGVDFFFKGLNGTLFSMVEDIGVLTYYTLSMLDFSKPESVVMGRTEQEAQANFIRVLQRQPILHDASWDMFSIISGLGHIKSLDAVGSLVGYKVNWDGAIQDYLCQEVKKKRLKF